MSEEKHYNEYSGFWVSKKQKKIYQATDKIKECNEEIRKIKKQLRHGYVEETT